MGVEHTAKSFKSGNSVAIRIPAALGVEPDREWIVEEKDGDLVLRPKPKAKRKFNIEKVRGCAIGSGLKRIEPEDRVFEYRPLPWENPEWRAKHMPDE
ncbi:AbrB/MazE/SpoVT family DNA-binding domain-containing protein [Novosphingobium jiangmenense]|uniref:AbrB/MazE/SpoVT family DNA-binding domain-containing protein n=1 Tax=Novosphingobium jiangmenense TaxID=2791981 RepID=A0ABS0HKP3_9SPHN|nr:AbrB/MazE/SpoVT family DNA-binding domain-containing protein [Novosphingobium jiangmenense]MBF9152585.1 AbrB/MazE/SpoVT family DNA-binding domain-containing protein [Novosphingobium jiangmenense]